MSTGVESSIAIEPSARDAPPVESTWANSARAAGGGSYSAACMSPASMKPPDWRRHSAA
jgi:hypothetical protein